MNEILHVKTPVISNKPIIPDFYELIFSSEKIAKLLSPGMFVTIKINSFFRRPFSIAGISGNNIRIIYKIIGKDTNLLSKYGKNDSLDVFGPLGNGYTFSKPLLDGKKPVLIAGGSGIASLYFLASQLKQNANPGLILYGVKTKTELIKLDSLIKDGWRIYKATEDGSAGHKGFVTELYSKFAQDNGCNNHYIYSAGPTPMLTKLLKICNNLKINGQVSLERILACGIGTCRGCVVNTHNGYKTVCSDGPVFRIGELII